MLGTVQTGIIQSFCSLTLANLPQAVSFQMLHETRGQKPSWIKLVHLQSVHLQRVQVSSFSMLNKFIFSASQGLRSKNLLQ